MHPFSHDNTTPIPSERMFPSYFPMIFLERFVRAFLAMAVVEPNPILDEYQSLDGPIFDLNTEIPTSFHAMMIFRLLLLLIISPKSEKKVLQIFKKYMKIYRTDTIFNIYKQKPDELFVPYGEVIRDLDLDPSYIVTLLDEAKSSREEMVTENIAYHTGFYQHFKKLFIYMIMMLHESITDFSEVEDSESFETFLENETPFGEMFNHLLNYLGTEELRDFAVEEIDRQTAIVGALKALMPSSIPRFILKGLKKLTPAFFLKKVPEPLVEFVFCFFEELEDTPYYEVSHALFLLYRDVLYDTLDVPDLCLQSGITYSNIKTLPECTRINVVTQFPKLMNLFSPMGLVILTEFSAIVEEALQASGEA